MSIADKLTDEQIQALLSIPKIIPESERKKMKWKEVNASKRMDFTVRTDSAECFSVFAREAIDDPFDFSVGLRVEFPDGSKINIMRCNGIHGSHKNRLEREVIEDSYHIHIATSRYLLQGLDAESHAENVDTYKTVNGALECLLSRCSIAYEES